MRTQTESLMAWAKCMIEGTPPDFIPLAWIGLKVDGSVHIVTGPVPSHENLQLLLQRAIDGIWPALETSK